MKKFILVLVLLLTFQNTFSQDDDVEIITHRVALGETMLSISKKYLVQPTEIYRLNKKAIDGISEGMTLYIPQPINSQDIITKRKEKREKEKIALLERKTEREEKELILAEAKTKEDAIVALAEGKKPETGRREEIGKLNISEKQQFIDHEVASGETLSGLSRKYGISVEEIQKENANVLKNGLQTGQTIKMPVAQNLFIEKSESTTPSIPTNNKITEAHSEITHKVVQGETLFSISRKYDVSVSDLKNSNENDLKNGLQAGQVLKIKSNNDDVNNDSSSIVNSKNTIVASVENVASASNDEYSYIKHKVEPKETLYSISKKYGVSVDEIKNQNQDILIKGLLSGQEISLKIKK